MLAPQKTVTAHSCSVALDLTRGRDLMFGTEIGEIGRLVGANGPNMCGGISAGGSIYFIDVDPWFTIKVMQDHNAYFDSMHSLRWGGACPGEHAANEGGCLDDGDTDGLTWNNDQWATQRVFFIIDEYDQQYHSTSEQQQTKLAFEGSKRNGEFEMKVKAPKGSEGEFEILWEVFEDISSGDGSGYGTGTGTGFAQPDSPAAL